MDDQSPTRESQGTRRRPPPPPSPTPTRARVLANPFEPRRPGSPIETYKVNEKVTPSAPRKRPRDPAQGKKTKKRK